MDARSEVIKILTQRRTNAQSVALTNKAKALSSNAYKTLDKRERELVFDVAKAKAHGQNTTAQEREIKAIQKQKADVLAQLGLTQKDLEPQYFCALFSLNLVKIAVFIDYLSNFCKILY